jgi:methylenetetrahydrofolate reductase (NADPH)
LSGKIPGVATFRSPTNALDEAQRRALHGLLESTRYELIPLRDAIARAESLPPSSATTVTASPSHGIESTIDLCEALVSQGHTATPHLAAHMFRDQKHLGEILDRCRSAGIGEAFVIGGDARDRGQLHDAPSLLHAMNELGHPFERLGVAAYPEGHPKIPDDRLLASLREKQAYAAYMTTQLSFDGGAIARWIGRVRAADVSLPIHFGIPGPAELRKLLRVAARIGVGGSARYLRKNRQLLGFVFRRSYTPDRLLRALAPTIADPTADVRALHVFTFNQVEAAVAWQRRMLADLS